MKARLEERLKALQAEFALGQKKLEGLEDEAQKLRHVLLRISGGIQVLEEELARQAQTQTPASA